MLCTLAGCTTYATPTSSPVVRNATRVAAPLDSTWAATLQSFAEAAVPIATADPASGRIESESVVIGEGGARFADCGRFAGRVVDPDRAHYSAVVRGDGAASSVQVTASFTAQQGACATLGVFELMIQDRIAARAEGWATLPPSPALARQIPAGEAMVIVERATVRAAPSAEAAQLGSLPRGWRGRVQAVLNHEWVQIDYDGQAGYVNRRDVMQG